MKNLLQKLTHTLTGTAVPAHGEHFHLGPAGPYVCDNTRCASPGLDPSDVT